MRTILTFAAVLLICGSVRADGELRSVMVNEPAPTVATAPETTQPVCRNGRCGHQRQYSSSTCTSETCRNRLFGGRVVRNNTRTVVRPVR